MYQVFAMCQAIRTAHRLSLLSSQQLCKIVVIISYFTDGDPMLRNIKTFAKDQRVGKWQRLNLKLNLFSLKHKFLTTVSCIYQYMWLQIYCFVICFVLVFFFFYFLFLPHFELDKYSLSLYFSLVLVQQLYIFYLYFMVN